MKCYILHIIYTRTTLLKIDLGRIICLEWKDLLANSVDGSVFTGQKLFQISGLATLKHIKVTACFAVLENQVPFYLKDCFYTTNPFKFSQKLLRKNNSSY